MLEIHYVGCHALHRTRKKHRPRHNHFQNILRFFDVLPNFPIITSGTMRDYYL